MIKYIYIRVTLLNEKLAIESSVNGYQFGYTQYAEYSDHGYFTKKDTIVFGCVSNEKFKSN